MKNARLEALSDGIFAIVLTLLVLDLKVPADNLLVGLWQLWPKFLTFVISSIIISIYWSGNHYQIAFLKKIDFNYTWLTLLTLMLVCLLPFSTALLGEHPLDQISQMFYGLNLIAVALLLYGAWGYALHGFRLVEAERISDELLRNARTKTLLPATLYGLGILISFMDTHWSLLFFALGPLTYFIPIDSKLWRKMTRQSTPL